MNIGTHMTHCCLKHGCKYGDIDCPVASGDTIQRYSCEECSTSDIAELKIKQTNAHKETPAEWANKMTDIELIDYLTDRISEVLPRAAWDQFLERYKKLEEKYERVWDKVRD